MEANVPDWLIIAASIGMMATAILYPFVRNKVLNWYKDIRKLTPLNYQIAKTYGHYIQALNFLFGLMAILFTAELKSHSGLAVALSGLIAVYWTGRVITQFAYYPMQTLPANIVVKAGKISLNLAIIFFAFVFAWLFIGNLAGYLDR